MIKVLAWKECREQGAVWLILAASGAAGIVGLVQFLDPAGIVRPHTGKATAVVALAVMIAMIYGVVCGAMLFAGEREEGTLSFLDYLTARRTRLWGTKALIGAGLTVSQAIFVAASLWFVCGRTGKNGWFIFILIPVVGLHALAWGLLCGSSSSRSALTSAALAAVLLSLGFACISILTGARVYLFDISNMGIAEVREAVGIFLLIQLGLTVLVGTVSWRHLCRTDATLRERGSLLRLALRSKGAREGALLVGAITLTLAPYFLGLTLALFLFIWPLLAVAHGVVRSEGGLRRTRPATTLFWLGVAECAAVALAVADGVVYHDRSMLLFLLACLINGFTIGQFAGTAIRFTRGAMVLALFGNLLTFIWWFQGGLQFWEILVPPLIFLIGARFCLRSWATTRGWPRACILATGLLLAAGWMAWTSHKHVSVSTSSTELSIRRTSRGSSPFAGVYTAIFSRREGER